MDKKYKNQIKTHFLSVVSKLSLLLIALLVGFSTIYAQSDNLVIVNDNASLIKAIHDPNVQTITLEAGYYEFLNMEVRHGNNHTIFKAEGGNINLLACTVSLTTVNTCWVDENSTMPVSASLSPDCPPKGPGTTWFQYPGPGTITFADPTFETTSITATAPGEYIIGFDFNNGFSAIGTAIFTSPPEITCPDDIAVCCVDDAITLANLPNLSPAGGTFYLDGSPIEVFTPSCVNTGVFDISYVIPPDANGCINTCTFTITVYDLPEVTCPGLQTVCVDVNDVLLNGLATPPGGIYSGPGVSLVGGNYYFNPPNVGISNPTYYTLTYTYTDEFGCTNSCTFQFLVHPLPVLNCPVPQTTCIDTDPFSLVGFVTPLDGTYSGPGVDEATKIFDPALAGIGTHIITYYYMASNGCDNTCTFEMTVYDLPEVNCPFDIEVCCTDDPIVLADLANLNPPGGNFFLGTSPITVFSPDCQAIGVYTLTYVYVDENGCENSCEFLITVYDLPPMDCPDDFAVCIDDPAFLLQGATPAGGAYSGTGVSGGIFNPASAGAGAHLISYVYTDANGCTNTCTFTITVNPLPTVTCPQDMEFCIDDLTYPLSGGLPTGGTYSGPGVTDNIFYPSIGAGNYTITYTYTDPITGCTNYCEFAITVHPLPVVECPLDFAVCIDDPAFLLTGATPTGGAYSGTGVSGGSFYPASAGAGDHLISYVYTDDNGCTNTCTFTITVHPLPAMTPCPDTAVCIDEPRFALTGVLPMGGTYTGGPGVDNNDFVAAWAGVGDHIITYTYTSPVTGCTNSCTFTITVHPLPVVECPEDMLVCEDDDPITLTGATATPPGGVGVYIGPGVTDGIFYPAVAGVGIHTITYLYTDENGCEAFCTFTITVYELPVVTITPVDDVCLDADGNGSVILTATVSVGTGSWSVKTGAPGPVVFSTPDEFETLATVSFCGTYTFVFTAVNGECEASAEIEVTFFDIPEVSVTGPMVVCGRDANLGLTVTAECFEPVPGVWSWEPPIAGVIIELGTQVWNVTVPECGLYTFTYTANNNGCENSDSHAILFFDEPEPIIFGPEEVNFCVESTYTVTDATGCELTANNVGYVWTVTGGIITDGQNTSEITVEWTVLGEATVSVVASIDGYDLYCEGESEILLVNVLAPLFAGQVKYWNEFETYMPTPFPTEDYATYPHDYFYVQLGWGVYEGDEFIPIYDSLAVTLVEPRLLEDLGELMSFFDFDLVEIALANQIALSQICEGWYLKIWDGGLNYYDMAGGSGLNPPLAARHLGNNFTYNNWGGVNATDALAVLHMFNNYNLPISWGVGLPGMSPAYGYYSFSVADVNSSGGITALDALTVNYRSVGLLDVYPNSTPGVQYSPNFRVTGRLVPTLPYMTWNTAFDYPNPDDIEFLHGGNSYLYFTPAWEHKYTSDPISLETENQKINIYYEALGDINSSHVPTAAEFKAEPEMELVYEGEIAVPKGSVVSIPVTTNRSADIAALTLNLTYNNKLVEVIGVNFDQDYFRIDHEAGTLRIGWFSTQAEFIQAGEAIAMIDVRVLGDIGASEQLFTLEAGSEIADANAVPYRGVDFKTSALTTATATGEAEYAAFVVNNYPNPFSNTTNITYYLPSASKVKLEVHNKMGQIVEVLVDENQAEGAHKVEFGRSDLLPGVYYYKIVIVNEAGTFNRTNSMILVR